MRKSVWKALRKCVFSRKDPEEALVGGEERVSGEVERKLREILEALDAARKGDLTRRLKKEKDDIFGELADSYNDMVDMIIQFSNEVTRMAWEVATEGRRGDQAAAPGLGGIWKALTEHVNTVAGNLTGQVRNMADATTAVAKGNLTQKITVKANGEILDLKTTFDGMVDDLNGLANQVSEIAQMARTWKETSANERKLKESRAVGDL